MFLALDTLIIYHTFLKHYTHFGSIPRQCRDSQTYVPLALRLRSKEHTVALHPDVLTP